ncbi:protein phosphatase 2C domain-containing protein [Streptomyces anulatus]|uniref:protein phosphatase 2C domain-containing protein n=1 Tax=Streptomyces anulatus TaxID=1892 RepID=UPI001C2799C9|nr:protein phosphatase 2C domain-containing protein [Streptomyces anulatus]
MSQQGEKPAAHEDDWWRKLYDETAQDTGPSRAADSLDDRFDSVSDTVSSPVDSPVGDHRDTVRETVRDPYGDAYEDPFADRYEEPDADRHENPYAEAYRPPGRSRTEVTGREPLPDPAPSPATAPATAPDVPDPRSAWDPYAKRDRQPEQAAYAVSEPEPEPEPHAGPERAVGSAPAVPPRSAVPPVPPMSATPPVPPQVPPSRPVAPRTTAFPAPWEAPAGQPGPRTFAAPRVPEEPEPARAPDPSALHGPPPDSAAADATDARPAVGHLGDRPPTYDAEPAALPSATSENLDGLGPDTVLDGARYGTYTLRAASVRGDSARFRGEPRRDGLLTARFGAAESALVLVAVAGGTRAGEAAHLAAADACRWIGGAVARSHIRLSEDIRAGRRGDLKAGLHRLTDRTYGKLRARAAELGLGPDAYTASLRCLLLSADPDCRTRVFFGVGGGGLFRLRDGLWQDLEPVVPDGGAPQPGDEQEEGADGDRLTMDLQIAAPPSPAAEGPARPTAEPFRFRASVARPGDTLLLCSNGLAEPMRGEAALPGELAERWGSAGPPGLPAFLADTQLRIKGYADDRTCAAVWEA